MFELEETRPYGLATYGWSVVWRTPKHIRLYQRRSKYFDCYRDDVGGVSDATAQFITDDTNSRLTVLVIGLFLCDPKLSAKASSDFEI